MKLIVDWKQSYKFYSNWLYAANIVIGLCYAILPAWQEVIEPTKFALCMAILNTVGPVVRSLQQGSTKGAE